MQNIVFITLSIIAFSMPFLKEKNEYNQSTFKAWNKVFDGKELKELPLTNNEKYFLKDFPGNISKFTDGKSNIIMRYVETTTRKLHSSSDCYKGIGYKIKYEPIEIDQNGIKWSSFIAIKEKERLKIRERIFNDKNNWTDVSSWYWENVFKSENKSYTAITVIKEIE